MAEVTTVTVKCRTTMKTLFLYLNLCLSVKSFIFIYIHILSFFHFKYIQFIEQTPALQYRFLLNIYKYLIVFYRVGDYKLIEGYAGAYNGWYPLPVNESVYSIEEPTVDYYQLYDLKS